MHYSCMKKECLCCNNEFQADLREVNRGNAKFCSLSCAAKYRNLHRKKYKCKCIVCEQEFEAQSSKAKYCTNACKLKDYRKRMKSNNAITRSFYNFLLLQPCAICGWNKTSCDVHHIIPVSNGGKNEITNLITLCPNCHRMIHRNLISEEKLKKFRESWAISSPSNEGLGALAGN